MLLCSNLNSIKFFNYESFLTVISAEPGLSCKDVSASLTSICQKNNKELSNVKPDNTLIK